MVPYFSILLIPALFSIFNQRRVPAALYFGTFVVFVLFVGLRYKVGMDWSNYVFIHQAIVYKDLSEIFLQGEPASNILFWISTTLTDSTLLTNIVAAVITLYGIFSFAGRMRYPWIAIVSATPYLIVVFSMSGIRQAMAVGVMMWLFSRWRETSSLRRIVVVFVASLFHTSALINFIAVVFSARISLTRRIAITALLVLIGAISPLSTSLYSANIDFYQEHYLTGETSIISPGALLHVALVWIPAATFLVLRKRLAPYIFDQKLMLLGAWMSIFLVAVYFLSSTVASRVTLYLYFVPMMFYPAFVESVARKQKQSVTLLIVIVHFGLLALWLFFANNSIGHIPYDTVLFRN